MAWINVIEQKNAKGLLKKLYERITKRTNNNVANILKVHSINPKILEKHLDLYEEIMHSEGSLSFRQREMISVVVSTQNKCDY